MWVGEMNVARVIGGPVGSSSSSSSSSSSASPSSSSEFSVKARFFERHQDDLLLHKSIRMMAHPFVYGCRYDLEVIRCVDGVFEVFEESFF